MVSTDASGAFLKLSELFEEFMCLESTGRSMVGLLDEARLGGPLDSFEGAGMPPRSPGTKSPKKRSHDETSSSSSSSSSGRRGRGGGGTNLGLGIGGALLEAGERTDRDRSSSFGEGSAMSQDDRAAGAKGVRSPEDVRQMGSRLNEVDLNSSSSAGAKSASIPRFYLPGRGMHSFSQDIKDTSLTNKMAEIESFFKPFPGGIPVNTFVHVTKRLCAFPSYFNKELCKRIITITSSETAISALVTSDSDSIDIDPSTKIKLKQFVIYWKKEMEHLDGVERIFRLIKKPGASCIVKEDLNPILQELLLFHPGLEFLAQHQDFQRKYAQAVITRIFYTVNVSRTGRISLRELRNSKLVDAFMHADEESDINRVVDFFSYEHFYVLYCNFFELDKDQDHKLTIEELQKYGEHALSRAAMDRVFQVGTRAFSDGHDGEFMRSGLSFPDFIFFMMSEEDKTMEQALEYWFKCVDLDGDGKLSREEMNYFFRIQLHRVVSHQQEAVQFNDVLCQMIDLIDPVDPTAITMKDLTRPDVREASGTLFDALFNLHKFLRFETRDPFQDKVKREDAFSNEWDRFCAYEYRRLSMDEEVESTMEIDDYGGGQRGGGGNGGDWQLDDEDDDHGGSGDGPFGYK
jgi:serine/threonine-protein phosphatase 2A regulatory subunit B''